MPGVRDMAVDAAAGTNAVGGPEGGSLVVEGNVTFAFKGGFAGSVPEQEALPLKPLAEVSGFRAALGMREAGDSGYAMIDEGAVAEEDHVRAAGFGMEKTNIGNTAQNVVNALPLRKSEIARRSMKVAGHPGIYDVIDAIPLRRTHQVGWAGIVRRGGCVLGRCNDAARCHESKVLLSVRQSAPLGQQSSSPNGYQKRHIPQQMFGRRIAGDSRPRFVSKCRDKKVSRFPVNFARTLEIKAETRRLGRASAGLRNVGTFALELFEKVAS